MNPTRLYHSFPLAATFAVVLLATALVVPRAHAEGDPNTTAIKFSDPTKPGTLKVIVKMGNIRITGTDSPGVVVRTDLQPQNAPPRRDGLRVISESVTFNLTEKDNVVTLDTGGEFWAGAGGDSAFEIQVPRNTNVIVSNSFGGEVSISDLSGDIEVKSLNGKIDLQNIAGGALVETMNGEIRANVTQLLAGKPLSFTSMNGEIDLHVPADAKASVRLRTQNGSILTDFDEKALVTKTEALVGNRHSDRVIFNRSTDSDIKVAVREAVRVGVEAAREAAEAMREAAQAAREGAHEARSNPTPMLPPPAPPIPPMTGGKLVSGLLNGGDGAEILITAMNGDITLRKAR